MRDAIHAGLAGAVVCGRVEPVPLDAPFTVVIDYAHNEAAAECLLRTLRAYRPTRLVAVFGCGGARSRLRRFGMGSVCARLADFCVITEDNSRGEPVEHILADIRAGLRLGNPATPFAEIPDRRQAIYYALDHAQPGDIIAILGKGHETTIERSGIKEPFVEREIVEEYWGDLPSPLGEKVAPQGRTRRELAAASRKHAIMAGSPPQQRAGPLTASRAGKPFYPEG